MTLFPLHTRYVAAIRKACGVCSQSSRTLLPLAFRHFAGILLFGMLCLGGFAGTARAQTAYVPGGLIMHPTAFTPRRNAFCLYAAAFTQNEEVTESHYPVSLSYSPTDNLQISFLTAYHQAAIKPTHTHLGGFLKYQLVPDTASHPAVALAFSYVPRDFLETAVVGVVSHRFALKKRPLLALHLGAKWVKIPDFDGGSQDASGFLGVGVPLSRNWDLIGEASTRLSFDRASATSFGAMYHPRRGADFTLGFVNTGASKDLRVFFGVGYPFGD